MKTRLLIYFFTIIFSTGFVFRAAGQSSSCPPNIDFEMGDFTNWACRAGIVNPDGSLSLFPTVPINGQHTIISAANAGLDYYGNFPTLCPNGSAYSVKLGNEQGNHQAESISYTYSIPAGLTVFSLLFNYAAVLQDYNHQLYEKPRFRARIIDLSTGNPLPCVNFDFVTSATLLGFQISPNSPPPPATVYYKDWTPVSINLSAYIGRTIRLEFITNDCVYSAHFGYAYIDVSPVCNGVIDGATICANATSANLTAPYGFQTYQWYSDPTFTSIIGNSQVLTLTPPPAVGTVFPVVVTPYPGFGCVDTLYATISIAPTPVSDAGPDVSHCIGQQVQIGTPSNPGLSYSWTPAGQVNNAAISNPMASAIPPGPTEFIVTTTDNFTGCYSSDTTYVSIKPQPVSDAGPDISHCRYLPVQIGSPPNPGYSYSWMPAGQVSDPAISNPMALSYTTTPTEFIVQTTDNTSGCISFDTTLVSVKIIDTSITLNGQDNFCPGTLTAGALSVSNAVTPIQWYNGATPIPGATAATYKPLVAGNYWASIQQFGCIDTTRQVPFFENAVPVPSFTVNSDTGCITKHSFVFTNGSTVSDGSLMSYLWKFSDGTTQTVTDAVKKFLSVGNYSVKLITTSSFGCIDSTNSKTVHVLPNGVPGFTWDSICANRPVLFHNLSNENGSALVKYNWNFNNGGPGSSIKNPLPVVFPTVGQTDVTLVLTALGCENYPDSVIRKVQVNTNAPAIRYKDITVPEGSTKFIHARDSIGEYFQWMPQLQLSNYNTRFTEFTAVNDVRYLVSLSDKHTCVTTDTLQMLVLKKPGFYLPTAFTPNGDGLNDIAKPYLIGMKGLKSFSVYNRWGNRIFYTEKYGEGWDGRIKGVMQNTGMYVWILEFYDANNNRRTEKGSLTLIR